MTAFVGATLDQTYTSADLTGANSGKAPGIGDIYVSHDNKTYRFVQYNSGAGAVAAVAGNAVGFYAPAGVSTGVTNVVSSDNSDTVGACAGVLVGAPANGEYGWIQTRGVVTLNLALTAGADGNAIYMNAAGTDGALTVMSAVTQATAGAAIDASAKIVYLNCPT